MWEQLRTTRLLLRRWLPQDRTAFADLNADPRVMHFFPALLTRAQSDAMIVKMEAHFERHGYGLWALERIQDERFVGFCGLNHPAFAAPFQPCVEIGWRLAAEAQGVGLATEAALAVCNLAFSEIGLSEIVSFTVPENAPSRRVMEKIGMLHDPESDFDHPGLPAGHPLCRHMLYRLSRE